MDPVRMNTEQEKTFQLRNNRIGEVVWALGSFVLAEKIRISTNDSLPEII